MRRDEKIYLALLLAIVLTTYHQWLFTFSIITKGDWPYLFVETLKSLRADYFSLWLSDFNFGRILLDVGQAPTYAGAGMLAKYFGLPWEAIERIVYFFPAIIMGVFGSYILIRNIFKSASVAFIGAIVFSFNTYILTLQTGHMTLGVAFALCPILFLLFNRALKRGSLTDTILTSLVFFVVCAYEPRAAYVIAMALGLYALWCLLLYRTQGGMQIIYVCMIFGVISMLLNAYWLLGLLHITDLTQQDLLTRTLWGGQYYDFLSAATLFHPWWTGSEIAIFIKQSVPIYFLFIPLFAGAGLWFERRRPVVIFFGILAFVGIFLAKQEGTPLPGLYPWLFAHVPGFSAFREASKFYFLIALSYSVLIASFANWIWRGDAMIYLTKYTRVALLGCIAFIFLVNTRPFITGDIQSLFVPRTIPQEYLTFREKMLVENDRFNVLWMPISSRWGIYTDTHPKIDAVTVSENAWKPFVDETIPSNEQQYRIISTLQHNFSHFLLTSSNVKYVVVPLQDTANDDDFFIDYGGRTDPNIRQWYINALDSLPYLTRVDIGTKELAIYENAYYKPYVHAFTTLSTFPNFDRLEERYDFVTKNLGKEFYFIATDTSPVYAGEVREVFFDVNAHHIQNGAIVSSPLDSTPYTLYTPNTTMVEKISDGTTTRYTRSNTSTNVVRNASFEEGAWTDRVGDCNAYDDYPQLAMRLVSDAYAGDRALELEATRHVACTNQKIPLAGGQTYLLTFAYQGRPAQQAGYYLGFFSDEHATSASEIINEQIPIKTNDEMWHEFKKIIHVPNDTIGAYLYVYAYATDNKSVNRVRYDTIAMTRLPKDLFDYWLVNATTTSLTVPQSIAFETVHPTKKLVHVKGASTPFYLAMSESYHPQWQLEFDNEHVRGFFKTWVPWISPDRIPDDDHFKLNGFLNGWYIDTQTYCVKQTLCTRNPDGTYDMDLVIEFFPQRWFYVGLVISVVTFIGCIMYLMYDFIRRDRRRAASKK